MILEGLKEYFLLCPLLKDACLTSDFLSEKSPSFALYSESTEPQVKKYASGDCLFNFLFSFRARMPLGKKESENKKINKFFEDLAEWIEAEKEKGNLPQIGMDKAVQNIEVAAQAHIKNTNVSDCVYEMKLRVIYYKRR